MAGVTLFDRYINQEITYDQMRFAPLTVSCPRCPAKPGEHCESTGGGNSARVATHKVREDRIVHWTAEVIAAAATLYLTQRRTGPAAVDCYALTESAAAPITSRRAPTPRGVRLSETQATAIETAAEAGHVFVSTAHFHGDAAWRQTANSLESKGILQYVRTTDDGYDRVLELSAFGWQVYRLHRTVIRRLTAEQIDAAEAAWRDRQAVRA